MLLTKAMKEWNCGTISSLLNPRLILTTKTGWWVVTSTKSSSPLSTQTQKLTSQTTSCTNCWIVYSKRGYLTWDILVLVTWTNNQPESPTAKKLDRLLVNNITIDSYPHDVASFLPQEMSNHTPCLLNLAFFLPRAGTFPYKFQNYLTKHPGFA